VVIRRRRRQLIIRRPGRRCSRVGQLHRLLQAIRRWRAKSCRGRQQPRRQGMCGPMRGSRVRRSLHHAIEALIGSVRVVPARPGPDRGLRDGSPPESASISRRGVPGSPRGRLRACSAWARPLRQVFAYRGSGLRHTISSLSSSCCWAFCTTVPSCPSVSRTCLIEAGRA